MPKGGDHTASHKPNCRCPIHRKKEVKHEKQVLFFMPRELLHKIDTCCDYYDMNRSAFMRDILECRVDEIIEKEGVVVPPMPE